MTRNNGDKNDRIRFFPPPSLLYYEHEKTRTPFEENPRNY